MTFVLAIPADNKWNAPASTVDPSFLRDSHYVPCEPERGRWDRITALLPEDRQHRLGKCGRFAVHLARQTSAGKLESLQPISCMDKTACSYCAVRYAVEAAADRLAKITALTKSARCGLAVVEARAWIPEWQASVKQAGCGTAEARGRLCSAGQGCRTCDVARPIHAHAARLEGELRTAVTKAWQAVAPGTGGVYTTTLELSAAGIELVIRLLVPGLVAAVSKGSATLGYFRLPDRAKLDSAWCEAITTAGGTGTIDLHWHETDASISRAVTLAHVPTLERIAQSQEMITADALRTLCRADGLSGATTAGKLRRVQRSAWWGIFAGRNQGAVLTALGLRRIENETPCEQTIEDHYKILETDAETITVQSTRTAALHVYPLTMFRIRAYCDFNGVPLTSPDQPRWDRTAPWLENLRKMREIKAKAGGVEGPRFTLKKSTGQRRAIREEYGAPLRSKWVTAFKGACQ